jgi:hypothetical protein
MRQCMSNLLLLYFFNTFTSKLPQHIFFIIIKTCYYDSYKLLSKKKYSSKEKYLKKMH